MYTFYIICHGSDANVVSLRDKENAWLDDLRHKLLLNCINAHFGQINGMDHTASVILVACFGYRHLHKGTYKNITVEAVATESCKYTAMHHGRQLSLTQFVLNSKLQGIKKFIEQSYQI
jgi:hypothetical protein